MNGIRGYLAFRSDSVLQDMRWHGAGGDPCRQNRGFRGRPDTDQADALEQFRQTFKATEKSRAVAAHPGGEKWRTDTWLVRDKIGPLIGQMVTRLNSLVEHQETASAKPARPFDRHRGDQGSRCDTAGCRPDAGTGNLLDHCPHDLRPLRGSSHDHARYCPVMGSDQTLKNSNDEIGYLAESFNAFVGKIRI